jgi:pimeloyl-ACP methyl ester carboxylesterase
MSETENCRQTGEETVVLVHGFFRSGSDMRFLARELEKRGYRVFVPNLPSVLQNVRKCSDVLAQIIEKNVPAEGVVHFVGHSMGGLVIRDYLSRHVFKRLGRVVLIGTPSGGSPYANFLLKIPFLRRIFTALADIATPGLEIDEPRNVPAPEVGIIIGTTGFLRKFILSGDHDGLVPAESVRRVTANDEIVVPFHHEKIHWRTGTAEAVALFLETGKFLAPKNTN